MNWTHLITRGAAVLLVGLALLVAGCANLNTINRDTSLGRISEKKAGKAIHLDIQQRLLIVNSMGKYCAEASPDALAAFAAAVGIGASAPSQGAVSAAVGGSSSAASIGLRTQSITLMRDALYRMCEAYANEQLSKAQVMALLSRSQDLTAVILATEQLTGAVVAQQAALSGSATADATAVMTATSELLEAALDQQERAQARLEDAIERKSAAEAQQQAANTELQAAQADRTNNPGSDAAGLRAQARLDKAQRDSAEADRKVALAEDIRALREKSVEAANERVAALQEAQDSAATTAAAAASSSATLGGGGSYSRLSDQSTQAIATAVTKMVNNVVNKNYVLDYCMAMITTDQKNSPLISSAERERCFRIIERSMQTEEARVTGSVDTFQNDDNTQCIRTWLRADAANGAKLNDWLRRRAGGADRVMFLNGASFSSVRAAAVKEIPIPCS